VDKTYPADMEASNRSKNRDGMTPPSTIKQASGWGEMDEDRK
jgi:hypothetical protein